jgi:hypothetical protein
VLAAVDDKPPTAQSCQKQDQRMNALGVPRGAPSQRKYFAPAIVERLPHRESSRIEPNCLRFNNEPRYAPILFRNRH